MLDLSGFLDIPDPEYRKAPGLNWSRLKVVGDSPRLYEYQSTNPRADTGAFVFGRAFHAALLQPEVYGTGWKVYTGATRRGKAWESFQRLYGDDYEIITEAEAAEIESMVRAVHAHGDASMLMGLEGVNERAIFWEEDGRAMKAKVDRTCWASEDPHAPIFVVDAKTTREIDPESFGRSADKFGYVGQMEHYARGVEILTGRPTIAILLAVEKTAPYDVGVFRISGEARRLGAVQRQTYLDRLDRCTSSGEWPGQVPTMIDLPIARWAKIRRF